VYLILHYYLIDISLPYQQSKNLADYSLLIAINYQQKTPPNNNFIRVHLWTFFYARFTQETYALEHL
jgi:hypothetical protein